MKEFKLDKIKATGTTVGEVHFPKNILHLPFDGSNGATSTSDVSNQNNAVTVNGAQISTAHSKFGGSSMLFDGSNDYLSVGGSEWNSNLNSGDFTVEFWIRFNTIGTPYIIQNYNGSNGWGVAVWSGGGGTNYFDGFWYSGGWKYIQYDVGGSSQYTTASADTWYHVAFVRDGNDWSLYLNGTLEGTRTGLSGSITSSSLGSLEIGRKYNGTYYVDGYIDDLRITKGLARYTSNFTPPTSAHLTSAGDVNKHIVVNSDADGVAIGTGGINQARVAKAWVNFNGTGTVAIRESYNISSLADRGTGLYSLNLSTALSSAECAGAGSGTDQDTGTDTTQRNRMVTIIPESTSLVYVNGFDTSGNADDVEIATAIIFGN